MLYENSPDFQMTDRTITIERKDVAAILTAHADDLRTLNFELIPVPERNELENNLADGLVNQGELLVIGGETSLHYLEEPLEELRSSYTNLDKLLAFKPSNMVCAGGAITSSLLQYEERRRGDADIFFYDRVTNEPVEEGTVGFDTKEAEKTIRTIFEWVQQEKAGLWYGLRNQNVTTLWICPITHRAELAAMSEEDRPRFIMDEGEKYQFIHRVFPTKASVIGGFDISACMFLYDGFEIYGLPISLFVLKTGYIIADLSRRSPSFEMRLKKYANRYGFGIIVPCLSNNEIKKFANESPFEFGTGRFGSSVTVGGCLRVTVFDKGDTILLTQRLYKSQQSDISDYDAGECDYSKLAAVNSISALQGKVSFLSWGGSSLAELFSDPHIPYLSGDVLSEKFNRMIVHVQKHRKEFSTMCRWFGAERCYKKGTSIKKADFPDVSFEDDTLPPPLNKEKKSRRKQKGSPIGNKTGVFELPKKFHKFAYEEEDEEYNRRWPSLTQREIAIAKHVIAFRCTSFQASMQDRWLTRSMVTWIGPNDNPSRQFTASLSPNSDVRGWYNPKMSRPLRIGIPHEVFIQLKLLSLYGSNDWLSDFTMIRADKKVPPFPRDVLKLICRSLWQLDAEEGRRILKDEKPKVATRAIYFSPRTEVTDRQYNSYQEEMREAEASRTGLEIIKNYASGEFGDGEWQILAAKILEHQDELDDFSTHDAESGAEFLTRLWSLIEESSIRNAANRMVITEEDKEYLAQMAKGEAARQRYLEEHAEEIAADKAFNAKMLARIPKHLTGDVHDPENSWLGMGSARWMELCREYGDKEEEPVRSTSVTTMLDTDNTSDEYKEEIGRRFRGKLLVIPDEEHKSVPHLSQKEIDFVSKVAIQQLEQREAAYLHIESATSLNLEEYEIPELVEFGEPNDVVQTRDLNGSPQMMSPPFRMMKSVKAIDPDSEEGKAGFARFLAERVKESEHEFPSSDFRVACYSRLIERSEEESDDDWPGVEMAHPETTEGSDKHQLASDRERNLRIFSRLSEKQKATIVDPSQPWMGIGIDAWIDLERQFGSSDGEGEEWSSEEGDEDCSEESGEESSEENVEEKARRISIASLYQGMPRMSDYRSGNLAPPSMYHHTLPTRESYAEPEEDDSDDECLTDGVQICDYPKNLAEEDNVEYQEIDFEPVGLVAKRRDGVHDLRQAIVDSREVLLIADPRPAGCGDMLASRYSQKGIIKDDIRKLMNDQKAESDEEI